MWIAAGRLVLDFYNNEELRLKKRQLESLAKDLRKKFNLSALEVADFDAPERCVLGLAAVFPETWSEAKAQDMIRKIQKEVDETAFARVNIEDWELFSH